MTIGQSQENNMENAEAVELVADGALPEEVVADMEGTAFAALEAERDSWKDKAYRLAADMENTKKRAEKEADDARKYAVSSFAKELLAVQDNLERALDSMRQLEAKDESVKLIEDGVNMVAVQLASAFGRMQIERVPAVGQKFNPELHQAMMEVPASEGMDAGSVVQELQAGYTIAGRLLRPALVAVAKK